MKNAKFTDKSYKLTRGKAPLTFTIQSRNSKNYPLMHFDETTGTNRAMRYAVNQTSPFIDEQDGNAILKPITFIDGMLHVPKEEQALQHFLSIHKDNGVKFVEVNTEKDAESEMQTLDLEVDALVEARALSVDMMETVGRVLFNKDTTMMTTSELRRDVLVYAKRDPKAFLNVVTDPKLQFNGKINMFFDAKILSWRSNKKEVYFNTPSNKKRMLTIPFGDDPMVAVQSYFSTDEGLEQFEALENLLNA